MKCRWLGYEDNAKKKIQIHFTMISLVEDTWQIYTYINICMYCAESLQSCPTLCNPMDFSLPGTSVHGILQAKNTRVGCEALQGIFLTQGLNLCLLHRQVDSLPLSHLGSPINSPPLSLVSIFTDSVTCGQL